MDFEILIVGDGPERKGLEKMAKEIAVTDKVKFLGFRTDLDKLYNQFDLFILPSQEEALSLSLIDAGNCSLPAIAFDVGGNKEIILDGKTGFIVNSEEELWEKAFELCRNTDLRKAMGAKAEGHTKIFNEENHLKNLMEMYEMYA